MRWLFVWVAVAGFCVPQAVLAENAPAPKAPVLVDVTLGAGGLLVGQVVSPQGTPLANVPVTLRSRNQELAVGRSDASGYFAFRDLQTGVYQVVSPQGQATYRVWAGNVAPPSAQAGVLLVNGNGALRAQNGAGLNGLLGNPWVVAGLIGTAVAVPVALHDSGPSSP